MEILSMSQNDEIIMKLLHAKEISFIHPSTKERMTFSCEPDNKFNEIMKLYEEK